MDFRQASEKFRQLKALFRAGRLSEQEFKAQLQDLMVEDSAGDWWMIGYETERWYRYDGTNWVQADPPGLSPDESSPAIAPKIQQKQAASPGPQNDRAGPAALQVERPPTAAPAATSAASSTPRRGNRKIWIGAGIGAVVLVALLGCFAVYNYISNVPATPAATEPPVTDAPATDAPADTSGDQGSIPSTGTTEITFWHSDDGSDGDNTLAALVDKAASGLPDITINYERVPSKEFHDKYVAALQAGNAPDLIFTNNSSLGQDARDGLVAELSKLGGDWRGNYRDVALIGMSVDNGIYGVPLAMQGLALVYNTSYITDPPADMDALRHLVDEGQPVALPFGCYWDYGFINAFGGRIFGDGWQVIADQDTSVADSLKYLQYLYQHAKAGGYPTDYEQTSPVFQSGKMALTIEGNWNIAPIRAALGNGVQVAPLPAGPGGAASPLVDVYGFYINPRSQAQEAAMQVALYLSNKDSSEAMMQSAGFIPANSTVDVGDALVQGFLDSFDNGTAWMHYPEFNKYWDNFCDMQPVFDGSTGPEPWLKNAAANANANK